VAFRAGRLCAWLWDDLRHHFDDADEDGCAFLDWLALLQLAGGHVEKPSLFGLKRPILFVLRPGVHVQVVVEHAGFSFPSMLLRIIDSAIPEIRHWV
jgi:hypothetical protein